MDGTNGNDDTIQTDSTGLTLSEQAPINAIATVELDGRPPSEIWTDVASSDGFQEALEGAVRELVDGVGPRQHSGVLCWDCGITALNGAYGRMVANLAREDDSHYRELALTLTQEFGQAENSVLGWSIDLKEIGDGPAAVFRAASVTPKLTFKMEPEFREQRADQRREICTLLAELSRGCDVHVVGSGLSQRWLVDTHREEIPVSAECNAPQDRSPVSALVETALGELELDGTKARILHELSDEPTETLSRKQLGSILGVGRSRLSQVLVADEDSLTKLGLVSEFGPQGDRKVELLEAGREFLSQITRQATLNEPVRASGNSYSQITCNPNSGQEREDGQMHRTTGERHPNKETAIATGLGNDVCLVKEPVELDQTEGEQKNKRLEYDESENVATVSVRAGEGLPLLVSLATTLATPWFLDNTLSDERLEAIDEPPAILRSARNIGSLSERALNDPQALRQKLVERGDTLESLSTKYHHATGDDKRALGAKIMKSSHGLTGSIVHLLDAAGIDVVREIRLPGRRGLSNLENLSESIARSVLIQSKYGVFAPYRHFLETDAGRPTLSPKVDAQDPVGSLIGSFVIRGKDAHRIREPLEAALSSPGEFLDDLPEFTVSVTVREASRSEFAATSTRMLKSKNIKPTRSAVSLVHTLTGSPYDAAKALNQLDDEDTARDVRPDELRYALGTLEADRICPDLPPTVGKVVHALLRATEPLSQSALADAADLSERSIRNNRDRLEALGIVSKGAQGYRLNLSFRTTQERRNPVTPEFVESEFLDAVDALLSSILPPERYGDPEDPVGGTLFWPPDPWGLLEDVELSPWIRLAARLTGTEPPDTETSITMGPELSQTALQETTEVAT